MKIFLYRLVQCIWGFPQTLVGFIIYLKYKHSPHSFYKGSIITYWHRGGGVSLGMFIFVENSIGRKDEITKHEYGHTIQSLILGPFYLIVVGIPSFIWCNLPYFRNKRLKEKIPYNSFIIEKCADWLGGNLKEKAS